MGIEKMIFNFVLLIGALQGFNIRTEFNIDGLEQSFYEFGCVYAPSGCSQVCPKDYSLDPCFSENCNFFGSVAGLGFCDDQIFKDYGPVKQLQLACRVDTVNGVYMLQGFKARHGPKPGSARYQWTDLHGSAEGPPGAPGTIIENWSMGKVSRKLKGKNLFIKMMAV